MDIIAKINDQILNPLIILMFALAVMYFLFGVSEFIRNQDNEDAQIAGKQHMFWGVVGVFTMMAVFGILEIIKNTVTTFTS